MVREMMAAIAAIARKEGNRIVIELAADVTGEQRGTGERGYLV
jgi:hypothetical protein